MSRERRSSTTKRSAEVVLQRSGEAARTSRSKKGFALVELLVVIVILGIVAGIVIFAVDNVTRTKKNPCAVEAAAFAAAIRSYRLQPNHAGKVPDGNGAQPGLGTTGQVAQVLYGEGLLPTSSVQYGATGPPAQDRWGFNTTTGLVTPDPDTCTD